MLSPETIQLMAQTYEEWMHDSAVAARPLETMNWAYQRICTGEDPWTGLGNFSHAWYGYAKDKRAALVGEPLTPPEQQTEYTRRWAAFCAASTEFLCEQYAVPCPAWVYESRYSLPQPWSGSNTFPDVAHTTSKRLRFLSPSAIFSAGAAFSKINTNCSSGCRRQGAKASPMREQSAATPTRKKRAFTEPKLSRFKRSRLDWWSSR